MAYKTDTNQIRQYVQHLKSTYGFQGPLHFTDFSNLKSVFESGYLNSRGMCLNNNINFLDGADHEVIEHTNLDVINCVRFYYKEQSQTLYVNEGIKKKKYLGNAHLPIPVYLLFDEEILYLDSTVFSDGNAKSKYTSFGYKMDFVQNMDWNEIFNRDPICVEEGIEKWEIKRKRHAELLSNESISLKHLKKIIFRAEADRKRAINLFGNDIRYDVNINMFSNKNNQWCKECYENNFIKDYNISLQNDTIEFQLQFNKQWGDCDKRYLISDINGNQINANSVDVEYQPLFGPRIKNSINNNEKIILKLQGNIKEWHKISMFINDFECVEEYLRKYEIVNHNITFNYEEGVTKMVLHRQFRDFQFCKYQHRYEIFDDQGKLIINGILNFPNDITGLGWNCTFENYAYNWNKIRYYINNVLCIDKFISNPNRFTTYNDGDIPF